MKTIIHLELSDEERNDLAKRIYRDLDTKVLATRKEVTELVHGLIHEEIERGREQESEEELTDVERNKAPTSADTVSPATRSSGQSGDDPSPFRPSRGDEPYLFKSKDPELTKRCSAVLDATQELNDYVWQALEENRT